MTAALTDQVLDLLPRPDERRLAVRVRPAALRAIRGGHPWVYDDSVHHVSHPGAAGDLAVVFDDRRRFVAIGLWDPDSPIRLRVLHAGRPMKIDRTFFTGRLRESIDRRAPLTSDPNTTGYRWVHGESDGLPGLVIDGYGESLVVRLDTHAWLPHLADVVHGLVEFAAPERVVLRASRSAVAALPVPDGTVVWGAPLEGPVEFVEAGLRFGADLAAGQKTGHFLDQRENRMRVGEVSARRRVLDVFCCTGGFGVHAAAGGARAVHAIDAAAPAVATATANMERNRDLAAVRACHHTTEVGDAFDALSAHAASGRTWDVVVIDPPSFAPRQDSVAGAMRAYRRLTELGVAVLAPGGVLVQSSCSSRIDPDELHRQVVHTVTAAGRSARTLERTGHPLDHPVSIPETRYLATSFVRADR